MAHCALALVGRRTHAAAGFVLRQAACPGNVIRVDVEHAVLRVHRRAAPLRSAIEAREDDRLLIHAEGNELPRRTERTKLLDRVGMRRRRARGEHVLGEPLSRERLRPHWHRLRG